jgi:hypothetical protein
MEFKEVNMKCILRTLLAGLVVSSFFYGCATNRNLYYWGGYEDSIYDMYIEPGKTSIDEQILKLEGQIEKSDASGMSVPPGLHAHLGYLYAAKGDYPTGVNHLQTEKAKFPESAKFIDGMIKRMKK